MNNKLEFLSDFSQKSKLSPSEVQGLTRELNERFVDVLNTKISQYNQSNDVEDKYQRLCEVRSTLIEMEACVTDILADSIVDYELRVKRLHNTLLREEFLLEKAVPPDSNTSMADQFEWFKQHMTFAERERLSAYLRNPQAITGDPLDLYSDFFSAHPDVQSAWFILLRQLNFRRISHSSNSTIYQVSSPYECFVVSARESKGYCNKRPVRELEKESVDFLPRNKGTERRSRLETGSVYVNVEPYYSKGSLAEVMKVLHTLTPSNLHNFQEQLLNAAVDYHIKMCDVFLAAYEHGYYTLDGKLENLVVGHQDTDATKEILLMVDPKSLMPVNAKGYASPQSMLLNATGSEKFLCTSWMCTPEILYMHSKKSFEYDANPAMSYQLGKNLYRFLTNTSERELNFIPPREFMFNDDPVFKTRKGKDLKVIIEGLTHPHISKRWRLEQAKAELRNLNPKLNAINANDLTQAQRAVKKWIEQCKNYCLWENDENANDVEREKFFARVERAVASADDVSTLQDIRAEVTTFFRAEKEMRSLLWRLDPHLFNIQVIQELYLKRPVGLRNTELLSSIVNERQSECMQWLECIYNEGDHGYIKKQKDRLDNCASLEALDLVLQKIKDHPTVVAIQALKEKISDELYEIISKYGRQGAGHSQDKVLADYRSGVLARLKNAKSVTAINDIYFSVVHTKEQLAANQPLLDFLQEKCKEYKKSRLINSQNKGQQLEAVISRFSLMDLMDLKHHAGLQVVLKTPLWWTSGNVQVDTGVFKEFKQKAMLINPVASTKSGSNDGTNENSSDDLTI